ncbi:hypothetical protein IE53DRAFT_382752 [Violaceomyces palustris]|uniref:Uncharacterized protein n=1 Tax=Violaceomyces palustris TaxID=1673888 RepID=A0ACD0NLA0_9BASI|nr:hypothetical protein IE53DRAFT_382752 [Violaceomyces palustris]
MSGARNKQQGPRGNRQINNSSNHTISGHHLASYDQSSFYRQQAPNQPLALYPLDPLRQHNGGEPVADQGNFLRADPYQDFSAAQHHHQPMSHFIHPPSPSFSQQLQSQHPLPQHQDSRSQSPYQYNHQPTSFEPQIPPYHQAPSSFPGIFNPYQQHQFHSANFVPYLSPGQQGPFQPLPTATTSSQPTSTSPSLAPSLASSKVLYRSPTLTAASPAPVSAADMPEGSKGGQLRNLNMGPRLASIQRGATDLEPASTGRASWTTGMSSVSPSTNSSPGPGNRPSWVAKTSASAGHSPKPSAGKTRLQSFVFPRPEAETGLRDSGGTREHNDGVKGEDTEPVGIYETHAQNPSVPASGTSGGPGKVSGAGLASLPSKPQFTAMEGEGNLALNPSVTAAVAPPAMAGAKYGGFGGISTGRGGVAAVARLGAGSGSRMVAGIGFANEELSAPQGSSADALGSKSELSLRYPPLPELPKVSIEPPSKGSTVSDDEFRKYASELRGLIEVYEKRDEMLRLRTEAAGFDAKRAWQAWENGIKDNEGGESSRSSSDQRQGSEPYSILGVRLLQRVAQLSQENDELGRLLESKLNLESSAEDGVTSELRMEIQESHALIEALDMALSKMEARAVAAERALEVVCLNNSTAINSSEARDASSSLNERWTKGERGNHAPPSSATASGKLGKATKGSTKR